MTRLRWTAALLVALLAAFTSACAQAGQARVYDQAGLLSAGEERALEESIARFQEDTGMDFVVVTSDEAHDGADQREIADAFYIQGGFGLDSEDSGVLYYIDMHERYHYLYTRGKMIDYLTGERIDDAIEEGRDLLAQADYLGAAEGMIQAVRQSISSGIPEGQFRYDVITGERLTGRHKALTTGETLVCAAIAALAGLMFVVFVKRRYQLKGSTYDYNFRDNCQLNITDRADDYVRTTTTRTRRPDPPSSNGGGHGGGGLGGGSGVHTSSGGGYHGGGGGRF